MDARVVELWNGDMWHGWMLILSNLALVPAIWLLVRRGRMASAFALSATFVASVLYHMCRAWHLCFMDFEWAVATDYLFVYWAIVWILTSLGLRRHGIVYFELHVFLFFVLMTPIVFAIMAHVRFSWLPVFGIGVPVFVMVALSFKTGNRLFYNKPWTIATFVLIVLAGVFMFVMPARYYAWAHSLWHMCAMFGAFTFVMATDDDSVDSQQHCIEADAERRAARSKKTRRKHSSSSSSSSSAQGRAIIV